MLHHSPTCSRLRAMGHCMLPKLLRCMGGHGPVNFIMKVTYASNFHYASFYKGVGRWRARGKDREPRSPLSTIHRISTMAVAEAPGSYRRTPVPHLAAQRPSYRRSIFNWL